MKKNILFLINGFGIERNDSYNVYSETLMPNLDRLTKEGIFVSIPNKYLDYKSAYRNLSMGINDPLTYSLIDNNISSGEYRKNQLLTYIINENNKHKSRIHIICFWDSSRTIDQLNIYLKEIEMQTGQRIFVHLILCQKSLNDYKDIERGLNIINYEMGSNIKIGIVTGEKNLSNYLNCKDLVKNIITEFGEKWKDLPKKISVLLQTRTIPCDARTFSVNPTYRLEEHDQVLIFNYSNVDITTFRNELYLQKYRQLNLDSIPFYSLFPVKAEKQLPFMYNFAVSAEYALNSLISINARCIIFDKKDNCSYINYYMTGLRNTIDDHLKYCPTDDNNIYDENKLVELIKSYDKELYIINYEIDSCKTFEEITNKLSQIDKIIGTLSTYAKDNKIGFYVSSLYGIEKLVYNQKQELLKINFSGRAPLVIYDSQISPSSYNIIEGSLYDLFNTLLFLTNSKYKISGLLRKKSSLLSFLYKKPKEAKK